MNYDFVEPTHELLSTELEQFDFSNPPIPPNEIQQILFDKMTEKNGLGLSANQIGMPYRVFIMRGDPCKVCFNPRIVDVADETIVLEEGCLTYPDLYVKIRRPIGLRARYQDVYGETHTEKFVGITARCFLHELDHLNGVHYLDRASKFHLENAKRKIKLVQRKRKKFDKIKRMSDGN